MTQLISLIFTSTYLDAISSVISGVIVLFISKFFSNIINKSQYYKKVDLADKEIINSLKPYVANKSLPDIEIFNALIRVMARKYKINESDMMSKRVFCEELIMEITSDIFIPNKDRNDYIELMQNYINNVQLVVEEELELEEDYYLTHSRKSFVFATFVFAYAVFGTSLILNALRTHTTSETIISLSYVSVVVMIITIFSLIAIVGVEIINSIKTTYKYKKR